MPGRNCASKLIKNLYGLLAVHVLLGQQPVPDPYVVMQAGLDKQQASLQQQRASVQQQIGLSKQQAEKAVYFLAPFPPLPAAVMARLQPDCPPMTPEDIDPLIKAAATKQAVEPKLLRAVIRQESAFRPCALSVKGAQGLMQLMPETAEQLKVSDAFDPEQNVNGGAAYLKQLLTKYKGDLKLTLGAYNAGPKRTDDAAAVPNIPETQEYVTSIIAEMQTGEIAPTTPQASSSSTSSLASSPH